MIVITFRFGHRQHALLIANSGLCALGKAAGLCGFCGTEISLERPRVRTREGQEVELESYGQLQQDGKLQRAMRERMAAGLSTRNYEQWRVL